MLPKHGCGLLVTILSPAHLHVQTSWEAGGQLIESYDVIDLCEVILYLDDQTLSAGKKNVQASHSKH